MASSKIGIAFFSGGIIPAAILKKDKDVRVGPHEAIDVPADYGQHLIADRFAYAKDFEKPAKAPKKEPTSAAELAAAEQAVTDAKAKLDAADGDLVATTEAGKVLADAEAALEKLKS